MTINMTMSLLRRVTIRQPLFKTWFGGRFKRLDSHWRASIPSPFLSLCIVPSSHRIVTHIFVVFLLCQEIYFNTMYRINLKYHNLHLSQHTCVGLLTKYFQNACGDIYKCTGLFLPLTFFFACLRNSKHTKIVSHTTLRALSGPQIVTNCTLG